MPRDGRIIDIRYERDPDAASARLLALFEASRWIGDRVARKLRELGLRLGGHRRLQVVLVAGSAPRAIVLEPLPEDCLVARCTLDPDEVEALTPEERDARLATVTFAALAAHCADDPAAAAILTAGRVALDTHGRRLAVLVLEKEVAGRFARVLEFLTPVRRGPLRAVGLSQTYTAVLEVLDRATGEHRCTRLFQFDSDDELHARVGAIEWKDDRVTIRPRHATEHRGGLDLALADLVPLGDRGHLAAISLEPAPG